MSDEKLKYHCDRCAARIACKAAFATYWNAKSGGGEGCNTQFPVHHKAVKLTPYKHEFADARQKDLAI